MPEPSQIEISWRVPDAERPKTPGGGLSRVGASLLRALQTAGGFQVVSVCLMLAAAAFGLWSHRAVQEVAAASRVAETMVSVGANAALAQLDGLASLGAGHGVDPVDLAGRVRGLRESVSGELAVAGESMRAAAAQNRKLLSDLSAWLWMSLALSAAAGIAALWFMRDRNVERNARMKAEHQAEDLTRRDRATGLANDLTFQDSLEELVADGRPFSLIVVDVDGFWTFNDRFGRFAGDVVLKETAHRLRAFVGAAGVAARQSGGRFALIVPETRPAILQDLLARLAETCSEPVAYAGQALDVSVAIGCAQADAARRAGVLLSQDLLRMADHALDRARKLPGERVALYNADLERMFTDRKMIAEQLPAAIAERRLQVYLQPQFDLDTGGVYGFEALVRWRCGDRFLPPSDIVAVAEERGMIGALDLFVFEEAVATIADWNRRYRRQFRISSNFSGLHLTQPETVAAILDILDRSGLCPGMVTVEITESASMGIDEAALAALERLQRAGCSLSIDDFGTGYSTFAFLQQVAFDEVKIDRSLVAPIETSATARRILTTVLALARALAKSVVVEGVETSSQVAIIRSHGARHVQGYLFGKPQPAAEALADATFGKQVQPPTEIRAAASGG